MECDSHLFTFSLVIWFPSSSGMEQARRWMGEAEALSILCFVHNLVGWKQLGALRYQIEIIGWQRLIHLYIKADLHPFCNGIPITMPILDAWINGYYTIVFIFFLESTFFFFFRSSSCPSLAITSLGYPVDSWKTGIIDPRSLRAPCYQQWAPRSVITLYTRDWEVHAGQPAAPKSQKCRGAGFRCPYLQ